MDFNDDVVDRRRRLGPFRECDPGCFRGLVRRDDCLHVTSVDISCSPVSRVHRLCAPFCDGYVVLVELRWAKRRPVAHHEDRAVPSQLVEDLPDATHSLHRLPVAYVTVPPGATAKMLPVEFARIYGLEFSVRANLP